MQFSRSGVHCTSHEKTAGDRAVPRKEEEEEEEVGLRASPARVGAYIDHERVHDIREYIICTRTLASSRTAYTIVTRNIDGQAAALALPSFTLVFSPLFTLSLSFSLLYCCGSCLSSTGTTPAVLPLLAYRRRYCRHRCGNKRLRLHAWYPLLFFPLFFFLGIYRHASPVAYRDVPGGRYMTDLPGKMLHMEYSDIMRDLILN